MEKMAFRPGTAALPTSEVELTIACRSLGGSDVLSKSDPMVVTYCKPFGEKNWIEFHRTETIINSHDPDFTRKIIMPYRFEENQPLLFKIYDVDSSSSDLCSHDFLGMASCSLAQLVSKGKAELSLMESTFGGRIVITVEELQSVKDNVLLQFKGSNLDKKNFLGKSDPFLVIMKAMETGDFVPVHKTEVIKGTVNPEWKRFVIPVRILCNADYDRTIKKKKESYHNSGTISVTHFEIQKTYTFLEYIKGGTQLNCSFAIDFTASNGQPTSMESLHYISHMPNSYEVAIRSVGSIIKDYDSDREFPVLGFGARVLAAYHNCIRQIQLYGPTNFAPVINHVAKFASAYQDGTNYFILLIITDGVISDLPKTIQAIVAASSLPMSIIIVGVGEADFSAMEALDSDGTPLTAHDGRKAVRDIVQFVPLRNFLQPGIDHNLVMSKLAREVLAEIPTQFLSYMQVNRIVPRTVLSEGQPVLLPPDPELLALL
ncbi:hypothetical protein J437_LFUL012216 [Ladona fulva]|uniref:C2 domain-containing protein n=1 Tax=Ladona fulva TaxID=123851 RepID=A0A8K0P227_LADFU|nr:hypothetical protein J437_LFUL012216 [Ladona fulva]